MRAAAIALLVLVLSGVGVLPGGVSSRGWAESALAPQLGAETAALTVRIGLARPEGGYSIQSFPLEAYVARVLTGEALPDSPPAALEALAIAVRTYTLANRGHHASDGFDLCNETHCQVMRSATPATERAAATTAGLVLLDNGVPASIYYSASCGGRTEIPSAVWPGREDPPFLPSKPDDGCGGTPVWTSQLADRDLLRAFRAAGFRGNRLRGVKIVARNSSGRVARLKLEGLEPDEISGPDLRSVVGRTLGWQHIKSTAFELKREGDSYRFDGHGSGHGVGMCVIGSARLAAGGESAFGILRRYYPGLTIASPDGPAVVAASLPARPARTTNPRPAVLSGSASAVAAGSNVLIALPEGAESERRFINDLSLRARAELAQTLGVEPPRLTLRFHSSVDTYERATTQPWFTSAAVVGAEIHLLPPSLLRSRGVLEQMIRRQIARVMIEPALADRPLWVREGGAAYFAGPTGDRGDGQNRTPALQGRLSCPNDAELTNPLSPGALTTAYALAQACFARRIAQGREWRDVR